MFGGIQSSVYIEKLLAATSFLREENEATKGQGVVSIGFCMGELYLDCLHAEILN